MILQFLTNKYDSEDAVFYSVKYKRANMLGNRRKGWQEIRLCFVPVCLACISQSNVVDFLINI